MLRLPANKYNQAHLSVPTNHKLLTLMGELEGPRKLLKAGGLSCNPTAHNVAKIKAAYPGIQVVIPLVEAELPPSSGGSAGPEYKSKMPDREYQTRAKLHVRGKRGAGLFMDAGTGKTKVALDLAGELFCSSQITGMLVFAPKGVHAQWVEAQIPLHLGVPSTCIIWPFEEVPDQLLPDSRRLKVMSVNWDSMRTDDGVRLISQFVAFHKGRVLCVADEAHRIKNKSGRTWEAADAIAHRCSRRIALTATPVAKDLTDEWAILNWVDEDILGIRYVSTFRNEFCVMGGYLGKSVIAHKNVERFREMVDPFTFRVTATEAGIAEATNTPWMFSLTDHQRDMIATMKSDMIAQIDSGEVTEAKNAAVKVLRIQQISNGFIVESEGATPVPIFKNPKQNPRIAALLEVLDSIEGKVIIWARFQQDVRLISEVLGSHGVTYFGETDDASRVSALASFKDASGAKFFISNPAAGGTGIDGLQGVCSTSVYYSNSDNFIERKQSEGRISRLGSIGAARHFDLMCRGAVDFQIKGRHRKKQSISDMAIGDVRALFDINYDESVEGLFDGGWE